jgi:predicted enzyme related to lactoylglutathione lyase
LRGSDVTSRINSVTFDCSDPARVGEFWSRALGYESVQRGDDYFWIEAAMGPATPLLFVRVPEGKQVKNRVHLDIATNDRAAEVDRLIELGATIIDIGTPHDASWTVMADPEGNEFCVTSEDEDGA